ncbi:hypothetical protein Back2_27270 [Nocardioides baekrokdamisoli]|uniref:Acyl-CoA dehydrogenase/oxidase C-terminal domain-containing protein n=1 Tax=Nocardioides baekrokdamisoli TaxID=1804624 RepID=A0A3G9IHA8_9ACTN|nr:acyl-CoA dehydrogenase family protein [Nocardioides baekrokdamisoli]BBH18440.1 hypothetical protein Back2_27270 [Nocardioides baekrokdamisoli]
MEFILTEEQQAFADSLDRLLVTSDTPAVNRAAAGGDSTAADTLWARLEQQGVGDPDLGPVEVAAVFEVLGRHAVPVPSAHFDATDLGVLANAAYLLGAGERLLADSVTYVKQRRQFGREIGSYQAIKHQLADVRIALDFARPLVFGAACAPGEQAVSAAKVGAYDAAYRASRAALQVHGAIGYTLECDISIWMQRVLDLKHLGGSPQWHRERILASLLARRNPTSATPKPDTRHAETRIPS